MPKTKDFFSTAFDELEENIDKKIEKEQQSKEAPSFSFNVQEEEEEKAVLSEEEKAASLKANNEIADQNLLDEKNELGESVKVETRKTVSFNDFNPESADKSQALNDALFGDEENIKQCFNVISPNLKGFRAFFVGNDGGYKNRAIENIAALLYSCKKTSNKEYTRIAFNEIEKMESSDFSSDKLYVIYDLNDAIVNLFNSDVDQQSNAAQARYKRIMDKFLKLPNNLYLIIDCIEIDYRGFLMLDARIRYLFSKKCVFGDYSDEKVALDFLAATGANYSKDEVETFLYNNKKYFPFRNDDLIAYLIANYNETGSLPEDRYKPFALEEAFKNIIGMEEVKKQMKDLESFLKARKRFDEAGIKQPPLRLGTLFTGNPGSGKALSNGTQVITEHGYVRAGDIRVGDILFNRFGKKVVVKGIFPQGKRQLYTVSFDDGTSSVVDGEHIWLVQDYRDRKTSHQNSIRKESFKTLTTSEILSTGLSLKRNDNTYRNIFSVPISAPVEFEKKHFAITPEKLVDYLFKKDTHLTAKDLQALESLSLSNISKEDLFVPIDYIFCSKQQRWKFVKQFLSLFNIKFYKTYFKLKLSNISPRLTKDICTIFRSLGAKVKFSNRSDDIIFMSISFPFDVSFLFENISNNKYVFNPLKNSLCKFIVDIKPAQKEEAVCFYVENVDDVLYKKGTISDFYELSFSNGERNIYSEYDFIELQDIEDRFPSYTCTERGVLKRKQSFSLFQVGELKDIDLVVDQANLSKKFTIDSSFEKNSYINTSTPLHPYVLGVLLGDGNLTSTPTIANDYKDVEIIETVKKLLPEGYTVKERTVKNNCPQYSIICADKDNKISFGKKFLEPLGLLNKIFEDKFIPIDYLYFNYEERLWLLKGLLDTDGHCNKKGNIISYSSISPNLISGIQHLVSSLGGTTSLSKPIQKTLKDKNGDPYLSRKLNILSISFPKELCTKEVSGKTFSSMFNLKRKADLYKPVRTLENFNNFLVSVKKVARKPLTKDILIPEDHTFLIDDFTVTHNTTMARILAHLLFDLGYIKEDKLIETDTQDFVQGEFTSQKTNKMLRQALGGVLFIDEAYNFGNLGERGMESIAIIVKFMEDYKDDLVVMFAGYQKEMNTLFLPLNSGLVSRIAYKFNIADYTEEELTAMYRLKLGLLGLKLEDNPRVKKAMEGPLSYAARSAKFSGNGRFIDNMVQATMISHAKYMEEHPDADIYTITADSIPPIEQIMKVMR